MAQWSMFGNNSASPIFDPNYVELTPNSSNRDLLFGNSTANAFTNGVTIGVYGANALAHGGHILSINVTSNGTGLTDNIGVTINLVGNTANILFNTNINHVNATATATAQLVSAAVSNAGTAAVPGNVLKISNTGGACSVNATINTTATKVITAAPHSGALGSGYANGDTIGLTTGVSTTNAVFTVTTGVSNTSVASLAVTTAGVWTTNPTLSGGASANITGSGTGVTVDVTMGVQNIAITNVGTYSIVPSTLTNHAPLGAGNTGSRVNIAFGALAVTLSNTGNAYFITPTITLSGTGLTNAVANAVLSETRAVTHTGWVLRKVGSGGRAGRVTYETLVASGNITGNSSDTTIFPV